jgi:hypothetical protein
MIEKSDVDFIHGILVKFLRNVFTKMDSISTDPTIKKIKPRFGKFTVQQTVTKKGDQIDLKYDMKCDSCGINHEARDFIRAIFLHLADLLEVNKEYIKFLFEGKKFLNEEARKRYLEIAEREPIKTQSRKEETPEILFYKGEEIGKIETLLDTPQSMLQHIFKEDPNLYERVVEQLIRELPRCISNKPLLSSRKLPLHMHLRLKNSKAKDRIFAKIIKQGVI